CEIKPLPDIEETERYIASRLLAAGANSTNIFTPGAVDFIFRCSEGIPRQINNVCDNAMLAGFAAGAQVVGREIIEEVADTFDLLPNANRGRQSGDEREGAARILSAAGRSELWAAGAGLREEPRKSQTSVAGATQVREVQEMEREFEAAEEADAAGIAPPDTDEVGRAFLRWDGKGDS
ncbi:MAG: hypothetical protein H7Z38_13135, partial [Rubrivivax sp.]|nr:hypothetical protein [Pyrinomonadaceae bacterium]